MSTDIGMLFFFFQAEDGIRDVAVTGVQTCALPITGATPFERFGTLGRNIFHGPRFVDMDFGLHKSFKFTEIMNLRFSVEAQNLFNHPNFDGVDTNLNSGTFGQAQLLVGSAVSRVMSLSLRLSF